MSSLDPNGRITRRTALGAIAAPVAFAAFGSRVLAQAAPTATPPRTDAKGLQQEPRCA